MNGLTGLIPKILKVESYTIVNPDIHGKGYGKMSLSLKLGYAFDVWKINKVFAFIDSDNIASLKIHEKNGFKIEGIHRNESLNRCKILY